MRIIMIIISGGGLVIEGMCTSSKNFMLEHVELAGEGTRRGSLEEWTGE